MVLVIFEVEVPTTWFRSSLGGSLVDEDEAVLDYIQPVSTPIMRYVAFNGSKPIHRN